MIKILQVAILTMMLFSCGDKNTYRIEGKLVNLEKETVYVVFESEDHSTVDTVRCDKPGEFTIKHPVDHSNQATLFFNDRTSWVTVYPEPGKKVTISGDVDYPLLLQVKGGRINDQLTSFKKKVQPLLRAHADLHNGRAEENDFTSKLANTNHQLIEEVLAYIRNNPSEKASAVLIYMFLMDQENAHKLDELLSSLDPELKDFYLVKELEQFSARAKRTALGAEAPNFTAKNIYGETVTLDTFKGKYLLMSFTAPWCDMCQTEDLLLDEIDATYSKEDLGQLLISLDDDLTGVRELLDADSIRWNLVTDSAGQATTLIDLYNVNAVPRCFLIDENRKIILKTESGVEVKQTLEKLITNDN